MLVRTSGFSTLKFKGSQHSTLCFVKEVVCGGVFLLFEFGFCCVFFVVAGLVGWFVFV